MTTPTLSVNEYPGKVLAMDSGLFGERMACCYLVEEPGQAAVVEVGGGPGAARMLELLDRRNIRREEVRYVIVTHVHLDHAGGAGQLIAELPNATLLVHPRGTRHMIDPGKLEAGTRAVYGDEEFEHLYGRLVPVPANRIEEVADEQRVVLGTRTLRFIDTPGHASHHFCVHDSRTNGWFCGDTFGLSYRQTDTEHGPFIFPTTTPIDFNPTLLLESMDRLAEAAPEFMYLTHYGRIAWSRSLAEELAAGVRALEEIGLRHEDRADRFERISADFRDWLVPRIRAHGVDWPDSKLLPFLEGDIELNTQGVDVWLRRRAKAGA